MATVRFYTISLRCCLMIDVVVVFFLRARKDFYEWNRRINNKTGFLESIVEVKVCILTIILISYINSIRAKFIENKKYNFVLCRSRDRDHWSELRYWAPIVVPSLLLHKISFLIKSSICIKDNGFNATTKIKRKKKHQLRGDKLINWNRLHRTGSEIKSTTI